MVKSEHKPSGAARAFAAKAGRFLDLTPADPEALAVAVDLNAGVNFDPSHPASSASANNGDVSIGSSSESYSRLLTLDAEAVAAPYVRRVNEDDRA